MSQKYGLLVPGGKNKSPQTKTTAIKRPSIFDEDSNSDEESIRPTGLNTALKRQDKLVQEKAVEEDPTVFQYDEVYDEMDSKRKFQKLARKDIDKNPKYISKLLAAAEKRKIENERRIERQVQKEREAEGEEFKDKESFVTSAYRKKLEEIKALELEEKREEYLESIGDVRKQGNLDGFYRHLYDQKVNFDNDGMLETVLKVGEDKKLKRPFSENSDDELQPIVESNKTLKGRKYRKRDNSILEEEKLNENVKKEHLPSNLDADSDFSIDSESDSDKEEQKQVGKPEKEENETDKEKQLEQIGIAVSNEEEHGIKKENIDMNKDNKSNLNRGEIGKKLKIDIWKKRTVGAVFDAALQRYFERKTLRESG